VTEPSKRHVPVLLERVVGLLAPGLMAPGSVVLDCTLGLGGHAEALLAAAPEARLIGLDRDPQALAAATERLAASADRTTFVHAVYDELPEVLGDLGIPDVQGVLFDLGVSSLQLDEDSRGFAYSRDTALDMRMDPTTGITAAEVVNTYSGRELARVLKDYGEERFASRIADAIVRERATNPLTSTARLADLVRDAIPAATRRTGGNPAKRTFQALRVEVNDEIGALRRALPAAVAALGIGGRLVVLTYQSQEDRITKAVLRAGAERDVPPGLPVIPDHLLPPLRWLVRSGAPTEAEIEANPRAASARLRAVERVRSEVAA
jgi:16S rRNA (cytosine1402-N4)-methyltransferase